MRIRLNMGQRQQLQPYLDQVRQEAARGEPGMLVAQIHYSDKEGTCWLEPAFLDHDKAKLITEQGRALESMKAAGGR